MNTLRQKVEAKYDIVENLKIGAKKFAKKALQVGIGLGILSGSALGMDFNQAKATKLTEKVSAELPEGVKFDTKFHGSDTKWTVDMTFKATDGSSFHVKIVHVDTGDGKFEKLTGGGDKKGDQYGTVKELGTDLAKVFSQKIRKEGRDDMEKQQQKAGKDFDGLRQEQQDMMQKLQERMGR